MHGLSPRCVIQQGFFNAYSYATMFCAYTVYIELCIIYDYDDDDDDDDNNSSSNNK